MYRLSANTSSPGVKRFYFTRGDVMPMYTNGIVTSFTISADQFLRFENSRESGSFVVSIDKGAGGLRYSLSVSGRIHGLSQDKLNYTKNLIDSSRFSMVVEMSNNEFYFFPNTMLATSSSTISSTDGISFQITGVSPTAPSQVDSMLFVFDTGPIVTTDNLLDKNGDVITDKSNENITIRG